MLRTVAAALAAACLLSIPALAREPVGQVRCTAGACGLVMYGARPGRWCGWYARQMVASDPGPAFNLAANWAHWGRPARPAVGVMVVWWHHVGRIVGRGPGGLWIVRSGNDGGAVRERPLSTARAIAFRAE